MEDLSLHILDIVENSVAVGASCVEIRIRESRRVNILAIEIADNGPGISPEALHKAADPFFTTRTTRRVGLGLPLFRQAAKAAGGEFRIDSIPGAGTRVTGVFQHDHIDRQPLGDMAATLLTLVIGHPEIEFEYLHRTDDQEVAFSTRQLKSRLGDIPISSAAGIAAVRENLERLGNCAVSRA